MSKIIFINQETGPLLIDIINNFIKNKCEVILYTGRVVKTYADLNSDVKIRKLCRYRRSNNINRIITWFIFLLQAFFLLFYDSDKKTRLYLMTNPPFVPFLGFFHRNKIDVHILDVYPDALLVLPFISKNSIIYKIYTYLNRKLYVKSQNIFTCSNSMKQTLSRYINNEKIFVIDLWVNSDYIKPINRNENRFINKYNLKEKFIVLYSGNLGATHNIEAILDSCNKLRENSNIKFIIIGDGPKKNIVDKFVQEKKINNLLVLPYQDEKMFPHVLNASDIAIVTSENQASLFSIPSKTFYMMASGSAIIAIANKNSELNKLIDKYNIGMIQYNSDINHMVNFIINCYNDRNLLNKFKENSLIASKNFNIENAEKFYKIISKN